MAFDYAIGMNVGTYFHHACVLDAQGTQLLSKRVNQHETELRNLFTRHIDGHHTMLVVVDQPSTIGRLTVAVVQDIGAAVRYLPGLAMRQLSRIHAGNSTTDTRDAYVIAYTELNLPDSLRSVDRVEEVFLQLKVLNGIDEDFARSGLIDRKCVCFSGYLLIKPNKSGLNRVPNLIQPSFLFNPPEWHPHVPDDCWCAFPITSNRPRCPVYTGQMKKNGTTSKGTTRWRRNNPNCGSTTTRHRSDPGPHPRLSRLPFLRHRHRQPH